MSDGVFNVGRYNIKTSSKKDKGNGLISQIIQNSPKMNIMM